MNSLDKIKKQIVKEINQTLGGQAKIKESDLVFPPTLRQGGVTEDKPFTEYGDLSLPCFNLAKDLIKAPVDVAKELYENTKLGFGKKKPSFVKSAKAVGPYLNFTLDKTILAEELFRETKKEKEKFGQNKEGKNKRVMIEYSNVNTHKEYHVGHLRNLCYGDAVNKILAANGYKVIPISYVNDFGIHTAKTLWALKTFYIKGSVKGSKSLMEALRALKVDNKGFFLGKVYTRAAQELEKDILAKQEVLALLKEIASRRGAAYKLWQKTRQWSIKQFDQIYKTLGIKFNQIYYESEFIDEGKKLVIDLYQKKLLVKSQQAIIANLEKYGLAVLMFLRSDGTALYPVADLALALEKIKKYKLDKSIYVVDIRQSLYFKQLEKVLELMGVKKEIIHLGYEFVKLPEGMMSSRKGTVISFETLWEAVYKKAVSETWKRHEDWPKRKIEQVAKKITIGAVKFEMIKVGRGATIVFDIDKALRFEGFTAAYLQYTYARIQSILRKSKIQNPKSKTISKFKIQNSKFLTEKKEGELIIKLAKYPETVKKAGEFYEPSEIAKYLFELAQEFNDYYHQVPILKAEAETRVARLALIQAINQVLANGLNLLGIEMMEEM